MARMKLGHGLQDPLRPPHFQSGVLSGCLTLCVGVLCMGGQEEPPCTQPWLLPLLLARVNLPCGPLPDPTSPCQCCPPKTMGAGSCVNGVPS